MIKIILGFIILFVIIIYVLKKAFDNPYKLYFIFGKKGSGKTTYLTKLALDYSKKGYKVFCNNEIFNTYQFDVSEFGKYAFPPNSVVLIDEVGTIWDCRDYKKFPTEVRDWFKYQRQNRIICYMTSQDLDIDKKIMKLCDKLFLANNVMNVFGVLRSISKYIDINNDEETGNNQIIDAYKFDFITSWRFCFIPRYTYFFKSFNPPKLKEKEYFKYSYPNISDLYKLTQKDGYRQHIKNSIHLWFTTKFKDKFNSFKITNNIYNCIGCNNIDADAKFNKYQLLDQ